MEDRVAEIKATGSRMDEIKSAEPVGGFTDFAQQFMGRGLDILEPFAAPSKLLQEKISGQEQEQFGTFREQTGIPEQTDTMAGRAGAFSFEAAASAIPIGKGAQLVKEAPKTAGRFRQFTQNAIREMGERLRGAPKRTVASEGALGASAGAAGFFAEEKFPESDAARFVGEIFGGSAPQAILPAVKATGRGVVRAGEVSPVFRTGSNLIRAGAEKIAEARNTIRTPVGTRVSRRIDRATPDRPGVLAAMDEDLAFREQMTPAQLSGDRGLLALEKSLIESTDSLKISSDEQLSALNESIKQSLLLPGDPSATVASFEDSLNYFQDITSARIRAAAARADEAVSRMIPGIGEETANRVARREVQSAFDDAARHEAMLFDRIDQDALVSTNSSQSAVSDAVREMGVARHGDIPSIAVKFLHPKGKSFTPITDVRELRGIQSKLRETSRIARSKDKFNRARIADNIADAVTDDLSRIEGGEEIRLAVGYSKYKNEVFRQGSVGKLLGYVETGEGRIPEGLSLERTLGIGGPEGREAIDDIITATATPEVRQAMDDFVRSDFLSSTVRGGEFNIASANAYLARNEQLLNRVPHIRDEMQAAVDAGNASEFTQRISQRVDLGKSKATLFIRNNPQTAFKSIFAEGVRSPRAEMRKLVNMAAKDETGEALQGLKASFTEYMLGAVEDGGFVSGESLGKFISGARTRGAMETLFSRQELLNMNRLARTAIRMDAARAATPSKEGILGDALSGPVRVLAGILGAAQGRILSQQLGGGTVQIPGIMAENFRKLAAGGIINPAQKLLEDAIQDEDLFREILLNPMNEEFSEKATRRLNAWAVGLLTDEGQTEEGN